MKVVGLMCSDAEGLRTAGLTWALMQSLSLQFLPFSQGSLLRTTPLSGVATGEGWDQRQSGFVHFRPNLQSVGDCGLSGGTKPSRPVVLITVGGGAAAAGVGVASSFCDGIGTFGVEDGSEAPLFDGCPPRPLPRPLAAPRPRPLPRPPSPDP